MAYRHVYTKNRLLCKKNRFIWQKCDLWQNLVYLIENRQISKKNSFIRKIKVIKYKKGVEYQKNIQKLFFCFSEAGCSAGFCVWMFGLYSGHRSRY